MRTVCAYCGKIIRDGSGEPDEPVSHGICIPCKDHFMALLGIDISKYLEMLEEPVVLVDDDARVLAANRRAEKFVDNTLAAFKGDPLGNVFECSHARRPGGCGHTVHCSGCVIRSTVAEVFHSGTPVFCRPAVLSQETPEGARSGSLIISAKKDSGVIVMSVRRADPDSPDR